MQSQSNNVVPLNGKPDQSRLLEDVCEQLNQLTLQYIHPSIDSLIPHLAEKIENQLEQTTNNHEIMMKLEVKNALLKHSSKN